MGRRGRRQQQDDDGLEREWLAKRQRVEGVDSRKPPPPQDAKASSLQSEKQPEPDDNIERQRLKKQRQKERQKEKKEAAKQAREQKEVSREEGRKLLAEQKAKNDEQQKKKKSKLANFRTLRKGVQCADIIFGRGPVVQDRKKCRVRYKLRSKGHLSGKIIDSSDSFAFKFGKGEVIQGWDIGMEGMRTGGIRRLIVPPGAGYGGRDVGAGRGADLYFEIEVLPN